MGIRLTATTRRVKEYRCVPFVFLGRGLDGGLTLTALERALARGRPEIHHSDQGVQYAADDYVRRLQGVGRW